MLTSHFTAKYLPFSQHQQNVMQGRNVLEKLSLLCVLFDAYLHVYLSCYKSYISLVG